MDKKAIGSMIRRTRIRLREVLEQERALKKDQNYLTRFWESVCGRAPDFSFCKGTPSNLLPPGMDRETHTLLAEEAEEIEERRVSILHRKQHLKQLLQLLKERYANAS